MHRYLQRVQSVAKALPHATTLDELYLARTNINSKLQVSRVHEVARYSFSAIRFYQLDRQYPTHCQSVQIASFSRILLNHVVTFIPVHCTAMLVYIHLVQSYVSQGEYPPHPPPTCRSGEYAGIAARLRVMLPDTLRNWSARQTLALNAASAGHHCAANLIMQD